MTPLLRTEHVLKAFGGVRALDGCSVELEQGTVAGLIGPNGSGKTTLFNVITGYERGDSGEVYLDGRPITNRSPERVFGLGIGRTFQLTRIFPRLTVSENMLVATQRRGGTVRNLLARSGAIEDRRRALDLLEFVGIAHLAADLAGTLSHGQRKLLELAYVLVADPAVILLDEPAGGVNPALIDLIADRVGEVNSQGKAFLIVEHHMDSVMGLCSTLTVLEPGAPVVSGPPAMIRPDKRVLDAYLGADI